MAKKENKIYCWNCGIGNSIQEEKCVKCGKKLRKKIIHSLNGYLE